MMVIGGKLLAVIRYEREREREREIYIYIYLCVCTSIGVRLLSYKQVSFMTIHIYTYMTVIGGWRLLAEIRYEKYISICICMYAHELLNVSDQKNRSLLDHNVRSLLR